MTAQPEISVSIITYNRKDLLRQTVASLERQTLAYARFEIVIVDDGSSDETPLIMQDIMRSSPCHIRYLRQEINRGKSVVRNISVESAKGDIVLFLEDDIAAEEHLLEVHIASHLADDSENIAVLGQEFRPHESIMSPFGKYIAKTAENFFGKIATLIKTGHPDAFQGFITCNLSAKKSFLLKHGLFDPNFKYFCEDIELGYRLCKKGLRMQYNENAVIYNYHPANLAEYCSRNLRRGYFTTQLLKKHPMIVTISPTCGRIRGLAKDMIYPPLMRIIDAVDRNLRVPLPGRFYQRIMDYYDERGIRTACDEIRTNG